MDFRTWLISRGERAYEAALQEPDSLAGAVTERTGIAFDEGVNLVVFVKGGEVVGWFDHPRNRGDLADMANGIGYSRDEARFLVALDPEQRLVCRE